MLEKLPFNFLGLETKYSDYKKAKFIILPVAYDATTSYQPGTRFGPEAIISSSRFLELYDEELKTETYKLGIHTQEEMRPNLESPEKMAKEIEKIATKTLSDKKFLITLGGEHSITLGLVRSFKKFYPNFSLLSLDAHSDLRNSYEGTKFNHASVMRRIYEEKISLVLAGTRSLCKEEAEFIRENNLKVFPAREIFKKNKWQEEIISSLPDKKVYLSIDLDCFDPGIMPSVGTPEPGGFSWYYLTSLLSNLAQSHQIIGFDIVELSPNRANRAPDFLAAKLCYRLINLIAKSNSWV
ncbi:MAG: agmatinase [Candidatus Omnitrophica bacterium CG1_02_41_171]|uniref:Agmatinase n=1 Tax=bacterium (Candidatus Ratteibacteria) CG15_BIG_FIL_POST_REV_8_21_14_020_41_12 TaxID=2014291 RepID=A0A2M7GYD8_9BACT|nr:MAG: agmatinase [Candidatus Omnitrophica bacterium CG1_02_41_171]PIW33244.1 MAG: agmatinase [bacterium (Candidatus Ratteibacteria) CG15_BIG_FIL_POST_REV_8_21_14_020_41_12]PIW74541.1 MAG: agmatinase [bacterium (Candidatus Ratteibacteria) CG_4_8_14_3_um_filter_41_36]